MNSYGTTRRIDSHHHFWDPATREYPWLTDPTLRRPFGPADLEPLLQANGIDATILVQTVSDVDETREFLEIAGTTPFVAGVVGWLDLTDPHMTGTMTALRDGEHGRHLVGIRHQVHDEANPDWLLSDTVQDNLNSLADARLVYDLLIRQRELPAAITTTRDFPHLRFVIDHLAKPPIASGEIAEWSAQMHEFAGHEHVFCKLSGLVTEADPETWTAHDLTPYISTALEIFGPDRLMFGSDWPVCLSAASYDRVIDTLRAILDELGALSAESDAAIFGLTATRVYRLDELIPPPDVRS